MSPGCPCVLTGERNALIWFKKLKKKIPLLLLLSCSSSHVCPKRKKTKNKLQMKNCWHHTDWLTGRWFKYSLTLHITNISKYKYSSVGPNKKCYDPPTSRSWYSTTWWHVWVVVVGSMLPASGRRRPCRSWRTWSLVSLWIYKPRFPDWRRL